MLTALLLSVVIPLGLDLYLPTPESNPLTAEKIELGRRLFFDRRLSRDGMIACATCHDQARAFSDGQPVAIGIAGRAGRRNAPALINRGYGRAFFWDGRETTLEAQVLKPIADPNEMDSTVDVAAARVGLAPDELAQALASFVRSILSGNSRFDQFVYGDRAALTGEEQRGLQVFRGEGRCHARRRHQLLRSGRARQSQPRWGHPAAAADTRRQARAGSISARADGNPASTAPNPCVA